MTAINLNASTERQWLGILRPRGRIRVPRLKSRIGMMRPAGTRRTTRRRVPARAGCCRVAVPDSIGSVTGLRRCRRMTGERWVKRLARRDRRDGGDLRGLFRRAVVAARRRADQSRHGDAVACGRHRGQYRPRQYRRSRRHADRARGTNRDRRAYPRHRGSRPRPRRRCHRAEGRGEIFRHRAADGAAARREPQSGRCRTRRAHHAGWPGHGIRRRYRQSRSRPASPRSETQALPPHSRVRRRHLRRVSRRQRRIQRKTDCWPASTGSTASA